MLCKRFADCMAFFLFKIVNVSFSVFLRNAQPLSPAMISGVWGYVTNKHLAGIPETGFLLNTQSYVRLHCLPVSSYPIFMPFRAVFLEMRKEDAYTFFFSLSVSFNLIAPSMTLSTMGRYFSGQSCNLWLVRCRCSLSSRSSSGLT